MPLSDVLKEELLIEPAGQKNQLFSANDAVDFLHAFPSCLLCDMVLLDSAWCHKVELATKRIREAGVEGRIAACYPPSQLNDFLSAIEGQYKWVS